MAKDKAGNELHKDDLIRLDMTAPHINGVIKELRVVGKRKGFMRVAFQYEVPFEGDVAMPGVVKIDQVGQYAEAKPARSIAAKVAPAKSRRA